MAISKTATASLPTGQLDKLTTTGDHQPDVSESGRAPIVIVKDVFKIYREQQVETIALRGVDLQIDAGEFIALVGPSGSGKSTLLNLIGGLDTPSAGQVLITGNDLTQLSEAQRARLRCRTLGFVFQDHNLIPFLTALENVMLPLQLAGFTAARERSEQLLAQVELSARVHHRPNELSGGEQQRVSIACALANQPALLLADEPTGELDSQTAHRIMELLVSLNQASGTAILLVTHDLQMAAYSRRLIQMSDGQIAHEGSPHA